jgi:hypothetical protein
MVEEIELHMFGAERLRARASWRYALLDRIAACARRLGVEVLAFGLGGDALRLVVEGAPEARGNLVRGVKVGTVRHASAVGERLLFVETLREPARGGVHGAIVRAHRLPMLHGASGPLDTVWSSHRDLLGFRRAPFFDPAAARRHVVPARVHESLGGGALPDGWPPATGQFPLPLLLRVSAAVVGTVPADPRCYATFVQLARTHGHPVADIARALAVTPRRVRQLGQVAAAMVPAAARSLTDERLRRVP